MLIVDGYNIINARRGGGRGMSAESLAEARDKLLSDMMDYAGYSAQQIVLVYDAWMSDRERRTEEKHGGVTVVYTQKGEIADHYIERLCDDLANDISLRRLEVRVASSDALEQTIVLGRGATRLSARELMMEMERVKDDGARRVRQKPVTVRNPIADHLRPEIRLRLEQMRKG